MRLIEKTDISNEEELHQPCEKCGKMLTGVIYYVEHEGKHMGLGAECYKKSIAQGKS